MSRPNWFIALQLPRQADWHQSSLSAPPELRRFHPSDLLLTVACLGPGPATFRLWPAGGAVAPCHPPATQTTGVGAMDAADADVNGNGATPHPIATAGAAGALHLVERSERAAVSHRPSTAPEFANMGPIARSSRHGLSALRQLVCSGRSQPGGTDGLWPLRNAAARREAWRHGQRSAAGSPQPGPLAMVAAGPGCVRRSIGGS